MATIPDCDIRYNAGGMVAYDPRDLLLASALDDTAVTAILQPYGFTDPRRADRNLQTMADEPVTREYLAEMLEPVLRSLAESTDPDQALDYLERFADAGGNKMALFTQLRASPAMLHVLTTVFGASPYLSQLLIRNPAYLHWVVRMEVLERARTKREIRSDLRHALATLRSTETRLNALRRFKRREILAIGVRDLLGRASVAESTESLTILAEVLMQEVFQVCRTALKLSDRAAPPAFMVVALGKLGGGELNFSSDVDLMYVCDQDPEGRGVKHGARSAKSSHAGYGVRFAQAFTQALSDITNEGYLFRVDLRLRPEGAGGPLVTSLGQCRPYFLGAAQRRANKHRTRTIAVRARPWERLAYMKAWPVAGDARLGRQFLKTVRPFIHPGPKTVQSRDLLDEVKRMKQLIDDKMLRRRETHRNVKLGFGGIREIELIVQTLQVLFGRAKAAVHDRNTVKALGKLRRAKLLTAEEHHVLREAYWFLRNVEHKLQMVEEQQIHTLPTDPIELRRCALRLGYRDGAAAKATDQLLHDHALHAERVHQIFNAVILEERFTRAR